MAVEVCALFDGKGHVMDIGLDMAGRLQGNRACADNTQDGAAYNHLLTCDHPCHFPVFTDEDLGGLNITFNVAIDLKRAAANNPQSLTKDLEVVAYDGLLSA